MRSDHDRTADAAASPFDAKERRALDAWAVPGLPDDFVARATARVLDDQHGRARRRAAVVVGGAFALAAAALVVASAAPWGAVVPPPTTLRVGTSTLTCSGCALALEPISEHGDTMHAATAGVAGLAAGAAITAAILVTVYDGRVAVQTEGAPLVTAGPGDQLVLTADCPPLVHRAFDPTRAPDASPVPAPSAVSPGAPSPSSSPHGNVAADACPEAAADAARAERLQARVDALERELRAKRAEGDETRSYGLSHETLLAMAERCELRWDMPPMSLDGAQTVSREAVEALGLDDAQMRTINDVFARTNMRLIKAVTELYAEVMGEVPPAGMAPTAMLFEITDKTSRETVREIFQRLSAERAGLAAPPAPSVALDPAERLFRLLTTVGDDVENELAGTLGPDVARALRDEHDGWGEKSRSRPGCPGGE